MSGRTHPLDHVPGLLELARSQLGVVRREQLAALGVNRHHVRSQLEAQRWQACGPRVVALMTGVLDKNQWMWVGVLHGGLGARLHGQTALELHGLRGWEVDQAHVLVRHGLKVPALPGVVVHHTRGQLPQPVLREGLPCPTAAVAAAEAVDSLRAARSAAGLALAVVQQRLATAADVAAALRPGGRHTSAVLAALGHAAAGADSVSEVDVVRWLLQAGLERITRQYVIETPQGPCRYDVAVELPDGTLLLVEVDGVHHLDPRQRERDAAKDAAAVALGHQVLRIPVTIATTQPASVVARFATIRRNAEHRARRW